VEDHALPYNRLADQLRGISLHPAFEKRSIILELPTRPVIEQFLNKTGYSTVSADGGKQTKVPGFLVRAIRSRVVPPV
jgi:hypothetical protein